MKELQSKGYFITQDGKDSRKLFVEEERAKNAVKPPRPTSAYFYFQTQNFQLLKAEEPTLSVTEGAKRNGAAWKAMDAKAKAKYIALHEEDVTRFEKQTAELESKGYFTMKDGTKSTEQVQKKFKYPKGTRMPKKPEVAY